MGPDWFSQHGWHPVGMGDRLELLAIYGTIVLIAALVAASLWWAHRRGAQRGAPLHRWPTASLASPPPPRWGRQQWSADEGRLRASHADRDRAVTLLREATAEGYLTLDEFEERMGAVYSARYLRDLDPLVDDIPGHPRPAALEPAGGWQPVPARSHPVFPGAGILIAVAVLAITLHVWVVPAFPLVLLVFLALRVGRHHRRRLDGHWGSRL